MEVSLNGDRTVHATRTVGESHIVHFSAMSPNRGRSTAVNARVEIRLGETLLAWDDLNINKDRARSDLIRSAYRPIAQAAKNGRPGGEIEAAYPQEDMKHDLDVFCERVWPVWVASLVAEPSAGDAVSNAIQFVAEPHAIQDGGTIIFAPPGRGKSYLGLICAVSVDAGCNTIWPVQQRRTMIINLERGHGGYVRRLAHVNRALLGDDAEERELLIMTERGRSLAVIMDAVKASIDKHGVEFIVLDSISRGGFGNLIENDVANNIIDGLSSLCSTWWALGHSPRADATHLYGSMMHDAGADLMVQVLSEQRPKELGLGLRITKSNDIGKQPMKVIGLEFDDFGLTRVRKAHESHYPELTKGEDRSDPDMIMTYLLHDARDSRATTEQIGDHFGHDRSWASRIVTDDDRFIKVGKDGRADQWAVRSNHV